MAGSRDTRKAPQAVAHGAKAFHLLHETVARELDGERLECGDGHVHDVEVAHDGLERVGVIGERTRVYTPSLSAASRSIDLTSSMARFMRPP